MPIPEAASKELLSKGFLRVVANRAGFITGGDELDFGVDMQLRHVEFIETGDRIEYRASGFAVDLQVKATCAHNVTITEQEVLYDLSVTAYNDLVRRVSGSHTIPLVLALFVLPDETTDWLSIADAELVIRRCAFLWRPEQGTAQSTNQHTHRVRIPIANRVGPETFSALFQEYVS
jgi:hypothetical protein